MKMNCYELRTNLRYGVRRSVEIIKEIRDDEKMTKWNYILAIVLFPVGVCAQTGNARHYRRTNYRLYCAEVLR